MILARFWHSRAPRHLLAWALVLGPLFTSLQLLPAPKRELVLVRLLLSLGLMALPIYAHLWLLTHWLERSRRRLYAAGLVTVLVAGALLDGVPARLHLTIPEPVLRFADASDFANAALRLGFALLLTTGLHYMWRGIMSHFQLRELRAQQLETELSLLKAQVNHHFLFNTLNNLYGLSLATPEQMPEALLQLAGLMRYQLDSSRQQTVTVGTEAEYLANYIGLEKLRLRDTTRVEFLADLPHPHRPLAPLLLLPLVENCFKHAIDPDGLTLIRIRLTQTDTSLTLQTHNSVPPHFRPAPSGLGLPNLRARLAQFYPGARHRFSTDATATHYTATLLLALA